MLYSKIIVSLIVSFSVALANPLNGDRLLRRQGSISQDGLCGPDAPGVTCIGSLFGDCCSEFGFCGSTADYCGVGCQPLYGSCASPDMSFSSTLDASQSPSSSIPNPSPGPSSSLVLSPDPSPSSSSSTSIANLSNPTPSSTTSSIQPLFSNPVDPNGSCGGPQNYTW